MSISNISDTQSYQNTFPQIKTDLRQLAANLKAGDLAQAQSAYATLTDDLSASQMQSNDTHNQDLSALGLALESGNLADAKEAFKTLMHDLRRMRREHHHIDPRDGGPQPANPADAPAPDPIAQAFEALRNALQSGDINSAQQAYSTLQQVLEQFGLNADAVTGSSAAAPTPGSNLNLTI